MALEPITRQEKIIAGQDLTPITRMEKFLKQFGGGGGGSVPKPLTYDYMPEGYPSKSVQTVTLMEEHELAFAPVTNRVYGASLTDGPAIVPGQTYMVKWDGTEYKCVGAKAGAGAYVLGNLSISSAGADTGEPFLYIYHFKGEAGPYGEFGTFDTSSSHTTSVKKIEETVTPMAEEFLPNFVITATSKYGDTTLDKTESQIREAISAGKTPVLRSVYKGNSSYGQLLSATATDIVFGVVLPNDSYGAELDVMYIGNGDFREASQGLLAIGENGRLQQVWMASDPTADMQIATKQYVDNKECILKSTTPGSTKKFKITVDDSGNISATEVT